MTKQFTITFTGEKTINRKVKALVRETLPNAATTTRMHVAGFGYVTYIEDANGYHIGNLCRERVDGFNQIVFRHR